MTAMVQTVLVILIVAISVAAAAVKLYRYFFPSQKLTGCSADACASCPYKQDRTCTEKK